MASTLWLGLLVNWLSAAVPGCDRALRRRLHPAAQAPHLPEHRHRDIALALVIARVCRPGSKLATTRWWADTTLAADLGVDHASTDEVYAAMDWLAGRQDAIEAKLVRAHLAGAGNPDRLALFDLSSSWMTGRYCPLAARGYSTRSLTAARSVGSVPMTRSLTAARNTDRTLTYRVLIVPGASPAASIDLIQTSTSERRICRIALSPNGTDQAASDIASTVPGAQTCRADHSP